MDEWELRKGRDRFVVDERKGETASVSKRQKRSVCVDGADFHCLLEEEGAATYKGWLPNEETTILARHNVREKRKSHADNPMDETP